MLRFGYVYRNTSGRRNALDRTAESATGREHDHVVRAPRRAAPESRLTQSLRRTAADRDLLEFALGEEPDVAAVRRPERVLGIVSAGHGLGLERVKGTQPQLPRLPIHRRRDRDVTPVG